MTGEPDTRLLRLKTELDDHARIARYLGLDFERPIQSLGDGYPGTRSPWSGRSLSGCSSSCGVITTFRAARPGKRSRT
jgi:hypothetical protein